MLIQKTCNRCKLCKSSDKFHKDGRTGDGFRALCIECEIKSKYPDGLKKCSVCKQSKDFSEYRQDKRLPNGLRTECKGCESARKKREYERNPEQYRSRKREFYRDHRQERTAYNREYYVNNTNSLCDYQRSYRSRNVDKLKAQRKIRYINNPDIFKARANVRRVRLEQLSEHYSVEQWNALCAFYEFTCLCCRRCQPEIALSVDHVIPIACGGSNSIRNIQPLCLQCNKSKYAKTIDYRKDFERFLTQIGLPGKEQ